ncbi:hypothetical protein BGZ99_000032 [Dissophora globulifera]|uniref:Uncharacterized protein n=1 Tax=Dissophora globulifera TaxID=979702 RepID=A0A9P6V001_9FUNG|nr:hypothetical protein BGZ99_000032 [Dissophora globulifera]
MPRITTVPHPPTLSFYRSALRAIRLAAPERATGLAPPLAHLQRKLQYNLRDGIQLYHQERDHATIQDLIRGGEQDLAIIQAWRHVDPLWLDRIFKKPTGKMS